MTETLETPTFGEMYDLAKQVPIHRSERTDIIQSVTLGLAIEKATYEGEEPDPQLEELREKTYKLILLTLGR